MGILDISVFGIILISGAFALYRGLVRELLSLAAWFLACIGSLYGLILVRPLFRKFISNPTFADITAVVCLAIAILVICTLINAKITSKLRKSSLSGLDRTLGFFFGVLRGVLLVSIIFFTCSILFSEEEMNEYKAENKSLPYLEKGVLWAEDNLPTSIVESFKKIEPVSEEKAQKAQEKIEKAAAKIKEEASPYDDKTRKDLNDLLLEIEG